LLYRHRKCCRWIGYNIRVTRIIKASSGQYHRNIDRWIRAHEKQNELKRYSAVGSNCRPLVMHMNREAIDLAITLCSPCLFIVHCLYTFLMPFPFPQYVTYSSRRRIKEKWLYIRLQLVYTVILLYSVPKNWLCI